MGLRAWLGRNADQPTSRVYMTHSVDEYIAGESYDLPVELADQWLIKGYCVGKLSREHTPDEMHEIRHLQQMVGV
jgi:hypothetical protein